MKLRHVCAVGVALVSLAVVTPGPAHAGQGSPSGAAPTLDYEFFKAHVQPIFLAEREGNVRCYVCHSQTTAFRLQPLSPGATSWTEEQTRRNFQVVERFVTPGDPGTSRLLRHPLAPEAGGDDFHGGGRHWYWRDDPEWQTLAAWVKGASSASAATASGSPVRIVQTNSAGDNIHLIDPTTNKVMTVIGGIPVPHGAAASPDGRQLYFSNEANHSLDFVDGDTFQVLARVPLSGRPNNIAIGRDGRRVYVAIREAPGAVDVVDTASRERVKSIPIQGDVHNTFMTPDSRYVMAGSIAGRTLTAIDTRTEEVAWVLEFENGVRPMAFETNADGSTRRMFVQISDLHGFVVVDFATRREVRRITLPDVPPDQQNTEGLQGSPSHGIGVAPDGKTLWVTSKVNSHVYAYSMPDLTLLGGVATGHTPDWLTFTPDSKTVYVANAGSNYVSAIDVASRTEVARIPVGQVPKRNITMVRAH